MSGGLSPAGDIERLSPVGDTSGLSTMVDTPDSSTVQVGRSPSPRVSTNVDVPGGQGLRPGLIGQVWCDLFLEELKAKSAQHRVTGRAVMYLELGIPLGQVLDALKVDEAGWTARVAAWEAWKAENHAAASEHDNPLSAPARNVARSL